MIERQAARRRVQRPAAEHLRAGRARELVPVHLREHAVVEIARAVEHALQRRQFGADLFDQRLRVGRARDVGLLDDHVRALLPPPFEHRRDLLAGRAARGQHQVPDALRGNQPVRHLQPERAEPAREQIGRGRIERRDDPLGRRFVVAIEARRITAPRAQRDFFFGVAREQLGGQRRDVLFAADVDRPGPQLRIFERGDAPDAAYRRLQRVAARRARHGRVRAARDEPDTRHRTGFGAGIRIRIRIRIRLGERRERPHQRERAAAHPALRRRERVDRGRFVHAFAEPVREHDTTRPPNRRGARPAPRAMPRGPRHPCRRPAAARPTRGARARAVVRRARRRGCARRRRRSASPTARPSASPATAARAARPSPADAARDGATTPHAARSARA